ncbi:YccF domain-containing protein [Geminocystis sp. CENA526]|uniref:YccF domain-containing protein n=1 Tax=Geminocystis sp. CENA526 TaxID=1355871 RepID=UPI003D6EAB71
MTLLGNIIWLIFGGFISGLGYILGGLTLCLTIVGIPFGIQTIKIGVATMTPFGKINVVSEDSSSLIVMIFNVIWVIFFGWEIALSHLFHGAILAITIIGLPFARQHFKLIPMALFPFGRELKDI